ncbi:murein DD-endopeptidase MepM/ murein hydrolase activator NlpD [Catalinimonas alkaloidigena]|uniref:M23 family metallopeptidase n=1 Tax=Catalinimonas alkaloidigena TaxID=1075417 RepID=UPI0024050276|nr:M23 family metallopeptidase [Catalinimonas alkaloidigena]MDF9799573.1 murein DD-endopeptidase MepM/ murein hydrolase activator NlpD [Catalinimonas alkaloidigena]
MSKIKYYYDTETCKYERIRVSKWDVFLNVLGFISLVLVAGICLIIVFDTYFESPKAARLKKENEELQFYYDMLSKDMERADDMLESLQERDNHVYRTIFEAEPIPLSVRNAGVGGVERYKELLEDGLEREELILNTKEKVDKLKRQLYIQTKSYDDLLGMAEDKTEMLASIPAIQPVSNKELRRLASGFGMRMHPIYKVKMMHPGIDFSAPQGTPIYATGAGKVITVKSSFTGYGKQVEIDHGFGYVTKYAHLSDFNVKVGQTIERGQCIGYVGNTGTSTAPHLHYEILKDDDKVNPIHFFYQDITAEEYEVLVQLASIENQSL